jgi:Coatomer epsilon subunit
MPRSPSACRQGARLSSEHTSTSSLQLPILGMEDPRNVSSTFQCWRARVQVATRRDGHPRDTCEHSWRCNARAHITHRAIRCCAERLSSPCACAARLSRCRSRRFVAMADVLFPVRNLFYLGSYQGAISEAQDVYTLSELDSVERDVFVYRSYIALGSSQVCKLCRSADRPTG